MSVRYVLILVFSLSASLLITGCDSSGSDGEDSPDTLIPLEEGNQWTVNAEGQRGTVEVTGPSTINVLDMQAKWRVENRSDGTLIDGPVGDTAPGEPFMLLKYPVEDGETYQYTDGKPSTFNVTVSMESVIVPAGEFDCILYNIERDRQEGNFQTDYSMIWVKPGLGIVRAQEEDGDASSLVSTNVQ